MRVPAVHILLLLACGCGGGESAPTRAPAGVEPTPEELAMEDRVHDLINGERAGAGLGPLVHDEAIRRVARAHSQDMIDRDFFAHVNPDGLDPFDRLAMDFITYVAAGENIAWNRGYADPGQVAVDGWMNSSGHRANILDSRFTHAGLGAARRASDGAWYFTQVFLLPAGELVAESGVVSGEDAGGSPDRATSSWSRAR